MNVLVSHPTGNRNVRAVIQAMQNANMLCEFDTTIAIDPTNPFLNLLPGNVRQELLRRTFLLPKNKIYTHSFLEYARMILPRIGFQESVRHEKGWASVDAVYTNFDRVIASRLSAIVKKKEITAVYAYEDGALETFKTAKSLGLTCIYDLPIAYWETGRRLMMEEAERLPLWALTLGGGISDSEKKLDRKTQELQLADIVVGPGSFVMDSIPDWAKDKKMIMSPFGSPENTFLSSLSENEKSNNRPLRVLFAGSMGQRKGLGDLFAAFKLLNRKDVELVVMGSLLAPIDFYRSQFNDFIYESGRPHEKVLELMRSCDVFCLPSIVEGRALVMQEAMSQGLPIIITENSGGADLIIEGETGFLVPIRDPKAIADKITWFLDNRSELNQMRMNASKHALLYTWEKYGKKIVDLI